jgi:hypothetical protein
MVYKLIIAYIVNKLKSEKSKTFKFYAKYLNYYIICNYLI